MNWHVPPVRHTNMFINDARSWTALQELSIMYCNVLAHCLHIVLVLQAVGPIHASIADWKFDHGLTHVRHDILHWLVVPERVAFKLCMTVYKCLHGMGPIYLSEMCRPSSAEAGRRHLRSANRGQLVVPRYRLTTAGRRAFSCAGPSAWNNLPEYLTVDTRWTILSGRLNVFCVLGTDTAHGAH